MRFRRLAHRFRGRSAAPDARKSFADVLRDMPALDDEAKEPEFGSFSPPMPRANDKPILAAIPAGYENGSFRVVPGAVLLFAKGKPTLRIEEGAT